MSRRNILLLPAVLAAIAVSAAPAFAGEDDGDDQNNTPTAPAPTAPADPNAPAAPAEPNAPATPASARLRSSQGCLSGSHAKAFVTGSPIESVTFFVDGKRVKTVTRPDSASHFSLSMSCAHLSAGAHRGRAVVAFASGASPASKTLRFQITRRAAQQSPRFTG
jgi:hypothetical protein